MRVRAHASALLDYIPVNHSAAEMQKYRCAFSDIREQKPGDEKFQFIFRYSLSLAIPSSMTAKVDLRSRKLMASRSTIHLSRCTHILEHYFRPTKNH